MKKHQNEKHDLEVCCPQCKIMLKQRNIDYHLKICQKDKTFLCNSCGNAFMTNYARQLHEINVHSSRFDHECEICAVKFKSKKELLRHKDCLHSNVISKCHLCEKISKNKRSLQAHMTTHNAPTFVCDKCAKSFKTNHKFQSHIRNMHIEQVCEQCDLKFKNHLQKLSHIHSEHKRLKLFEAASCKFCGKQMKNAASLTNHVRFVHLKKSHFKCDLCSEDSIRVFQSNSHVDRHKLQVHKDDPRVQPLKMKAAASAPPKPTVRRRKTKEKI